jgi:menaquinone-9 beta-reductase
MELFDVIVVGAGPAGASAARSLTDRGLSVLVLERGSFPRAKPCAGWVSPWVFELIGVIPGDYAARATLVSFSSLIIWDARDIAREVAFDRVKGYAIVRSEFDAFLVSLLKGARLLEKTEVTNVRRDADGIVVNGRYAAPVVIGAAGHRCPVARQFGQIAPDERYITAVVSETPLGRDVICSLTQYPDVPQIIFNDDFSGYGWYFPKGDYLNIGVGTTAPGRLGACRDALMARLEKKGMLPDSRRYPLARFSGHAYKLIRVSPRRLFSDRVVLTGDAAGVAYNMSGEGIGPAIFSGLCAAEAVVDSPGDYSAGSLGIYRERLYARFGTPYGQDLLSVVSSIPGLVTRAARRLAVGNRAARRFLIAGCWFFRD